MKTIPGMQLDAFIVDSASAQQLARDKRTPVLISEGERYIGVVVPHLVAEALEREMGYAHFFDNNAVKAHSRHFLNLVLSDGLLRFGPERSYRSWVGFLSIERLPDLFRVRPEWQASFDWPSKLEEAMAVSNG